MKVGIMSMQRIKNYGSFLQAYGLKMTIENLGHEVVFVDYKIEKPIVPFSTEKGVIYRIACKVYHIIRRIVFKKKTLAGLFDMKYFAMLGLSEIRNYRTKVDVLVIGSDEVFNCLQTNRNVGYSKELFGKDNNTYKVISYAASCGYTTLKGLKNYGINSEVGELLRVFSNISVRDNNSFKVVKELTGIPPVINVDPVIISNFDKLTTPQSGLNNYILIYAYENRINSEVEIKAIKRYAEKYNKKLVSVGTHQKWTDIKFEADPFELLAYVKGADYIITDTFYGSIYSIKYNRPFATIVRESNKQKLRDLLHRFSVEDREVRDMDKLEEILQRPINFERVNRIISVETEKSIRYLKENIRVTCEEGLKDYMEKQIDGGNRETDLVGGLLLNTHIQVLNESFDVKRRDKNMRKIRKAIIPAAGLGTRFLPATKAQPKEMLPIVDKPTIQYIVEEAIKAGIEDIIIVTGRNKRAIEDHFDRSMELEVYLEKNAKEELLDLVQDVAQMADIYYVRQKEALGLGHAIYSARKFIGNEPFAVLLGDDIIYSEVPALRQMINQYERYGASIVGVQEVPLSDTSKYGIVDGEKFADRLYRAKDMVEKPRPEDAPETHLAIMGRYILNPEIFDILSVLPAGKGGEIQLTDGIKELGRSQEILAYEFEGRRYDVGDKLGFVEATIEYALRRGDLSEDIITFLRNLVQKTDH